jgi:hypothetical protein
MSLNTHYSLWGLKKLTLFLDYENVILELHFGHVVSQELEHHSRCIFEYIQLALQSTLHNNLTMNEYD